MDIQTYLARVDERDVAVATQCSVHTVRKWRQGRRIPSRKAAARLIDFSRGELSWGGIYNAAPQDSRDAA